MVADGLAVAAIDCRRGRDVDAASGEVRIIREPDQIQKPARERVQKPARKADVDSWVIPPFPSPDAAT